MRTTATLAGVTLSVAAVSDVGLRRSHNAGDRAAAAIVSAFSAAIEPGEPTSVEAVSAALAAADTAVAEVADGTARGAGATVAGAALVLGEDGAPAWLVFNVGDARVYRHRGAALQQITVDHSLGQELFDAGRISAHELAVFPDRNVVTRAIGATDSRADSWLAPVVHGERILVCSDGLPTEVPDELIRATLTATGDAAAASAALVELARRAGARDNVTVVLADVVSGGEILPDFAEDAAFFLDDTTEPVRAR